MGRVAGAFLKRNSGIPEARHVGVNGDAKSSEGAAGQRNRDRASAGNLRNDLRDEHKQRLLPPKQKSPPAKRTKKAGSLLGRR